MVACWNLFNVWTYCIYLLFITLSTLGEEQEDAVTVLTDDDFRIANQMKPAELYGSSTSNALPQSNKFHGDIVGKAATSLKQFRRKGGVRRNGVRMSYDKWPGGRIPYVLSQRYNQRERGILARAFQMYHDKTCVRFVAHNGERDYLYIGKIDGCFSDVGRAGGRQEVSLDDGCMEYDTAIHELMHAVGFWHEHERWDRDDYISIVWQNIDRDAYDQFGKVNLFESDYYGEPYDYFSIMHYDSRSFSKNGRNTIEAKQPGMTEVVGKVKDFSGIDLRKINKMYSCANVAPAPPEPLPPILNSSPQQQSFVPQQNFLPQQFAAPTMPPQQIAEPPSTVNNRKCRDKATLCWRWVSRCRSPFFESVMKEFCESTCGFCSESAINNVPFVSSAASWSKR